MFNICEIDLVDNAEIIGEDFGKGPFNSGCGTTADPSAPVNVKLRKGL